MSLAPVEFDGVSGIRRTGHQIQKVRLYRISPDGTYTTKRIIVGSGITTNYPEILNEGWLTEANFRIIAGLANLTSAEGTGVTMPEHLKAARLAELGITMEQPKAATVSAPQAPAPAPVKRKRGRPRKNPEPQTQPGEPTREGGDA